MKILFLLYKNNCHNLYQQFINNPPAGFEYYTLDQFLNEDIYIDTKNIIKLLLYKICAIHKILYIAKRNNIDLIYSCNGQILLNSPIPWIMDLEHALSLVGLNTNLWKIGKLLLPTILNQRQLKQIIPWTNAGTKTLITNLNLNESIIKKIKSIPLCSTNSGTLKRKFDGKFTILFVTSKNYNYESEFYSKGGKYVVEIFKILNSFVDAQLIIRGKIPLEYQYLKNNSNIKIYDKILNENKFKKLFLKSHVLLYPGYQSPGMLFIDSLCYSLPVICSDIFANNEMVKNKETGFLVPLSPTSSVNNLFVTQGIKDIPSGKNSKTDIIDQNMVNQYVRILLQLEKERGVLKNISTNCFNSYLEKFSLHRRNKKLSILYNSCLQK